MLMVTDNYQETYLLLRDLNYFIWWRLLGRKFSRIQKLLQVIHYTPIVIHNGELLESTRNMFYLS